MRIFGTLLLTLMLIVPASAGPLDDIPIDASKVEVLVREASEKLDLELPEQLMTPGQREVFSNFSISKEQGMDLAVELLKAASSGELKSVVPQALGVFDSDQQQKLAPSSEQVDLLFSVFQKLNR